MIAMRKPARRGVKCWCWCGLLLPVIALAQAPVPPRETSEKLRTKLPSLWVLVNCPCAPPPFCASLIVVHCAASGFSACCWAGLSSVQVGPPAATLSRERGRWPAPQHPP